MVGTKTNVIAAVRVTDKFVADSPVLSELVTECAQHFDVKQVAADKAYSGVTNLETIAAVGASAFVPFKVNALANATRNPSSVWTKLFYFFHMNRDEFLPRYHTRSNVESTFSSMKRKFGDVLRSKTPVAQRNELLVKVLCHNIVCLIHEIHESGAAATFPILTPPSGDSITGCVTPSQPSFW